MSAMEDIRSRKLAPIYNALESGNWRQAVRLCEKRDVEKWLTTKALKANGLWRLGNYDEGLRLCLEVQGATPTDDDTLAAMSYNYRIMNRREHVVPMFEAAAKAKPGDASLLKELFMCYVRAKHYLKAQQTATKLYKVDAKGGKFIIWAAATMLIQAERKDASAGPMTLPLAEKMTLKVLGEKAANGYRPVGEELRLYLDILNLQGKHREALEALGRFEPSTSTSEEAGSSGGKGTIEDESSLEDGTIVHMQGLDRLELKAELHEKLGTEDDLALAEEIFQGLVRRSPDQWSYYVTLLDLVDKRCGLSKSAAAASEGEQREWPAALTGTLNLIRDLQRENPRWRGPFLAEMELFKRAVVWFGRDHVLSGEICLPSGSTDVQDNAASGVSTSSEAVSEEGKRTLWGVLCRCIAWYMNAFSAKLCCFRDMRPYLALFALGGKDLQEGLAWLRAFFLREAAESRSEAAENEAAEVAPLDHEARDVGVRRLHRYICACKARHLLGDYTASSDGKPGDAGMPNGVSGCAGTGDGGEERRYRDLVRELTKHYRATLHLNVGGEGGQREVQHGDELVILAARTLLRLCDLYDREIASGGSEVKGYLGRVEVACLLEAAMSCSPYNTHLKILAIEVYRQLGSFARGLTLFDDLDVKQIQVDTLSYLILGPSHCFGLYGEVQGKCKGIRGVHRNCRNETAEHVARAFDRGNYSKGAEVDRFQREKLDVSLQLAMAKAEKVTMDVILDHQTFTSAARYLQEEVIPQREGGVCFPGDQWLESLNENMDYSVQLDRCCAVAKAEDASVDAARTRSLKAGLKRRLLANETLLKALKGDPPREVESKATELEAAVEAAAGVSRELDGVTASLASLDVSAVKSVDGDVVRDNKNSTATAALPWKMLAEASRALAYTHRVISAAGAGTAGTEDAECLESALVAMRRGAEAAAAYGRVFVEFRRHVCVLERGDAAGEKAYQAETPLRKEWLALPSKGLADGGVYACMILQALAAELPLDKKKKGKGKGKGKAKRSSGGTAAESTTGGGASPAVSKLQKGLAAFGWEVSELLRSMSATLKSEISAKLEPAHPGETLSRLLKGDLGAQYEPAIGVLWEDTAEEWCDKDVVPTAVTDVTRGQATCCQRLLSVVTENLAMLTRWEKKEG